MRANCKVPAAKGGGEDDILGTGIGDGVIGRDINGGGFDNRLSGGVAILQ
jgi:hypothetical protein